MPRLWHIGSIRGWRRAAKRISSEPIGILLKRDGVFPMVCSLATVCIATCVRIPFQSILGEASPFLFYWPSVVAVALVFGLRPSLLAMAAATLQADYFWMPPHRALGLNEVESLQILTFCFGTGVIGCLSEWLHREAHGNRQLRATLATAVEPIVTTDQQGRIIFLNPAAQILLGIRSEEAVGQVMEGVLLLINPSDGRPVNHLLQQSLLGESCLLPPDLVLVVNGKQLAVKVTISRMLGAKSQRAGCVVIFDPKPLSSGVQPHSVISHLGWAGVKPAC